jgi:hypothetical protein
VLDPESQESPAATGSATHADAKGEKLIATRLAIANVLARADEPQLKWSNSRGQAYRDCPRSHYWATLAAEAWRQGSLAVARVAKRLKTLTSFDLAAGNEVHARATASAAAIREEAPRPSIRRMREQCIAALHALCVSSRDRLDEWLEHPATDMMFMERYYGRGFTRDGARRVGARLERALATLQGLSLWAELAACDPTTILTPPKGTKYILPDILGVEPVLVWAVPDLVFQLPDEGFWVVCDFKTGQLAGTDRRAFLAAKAQVVSYAAWLRHGLGVLGPDDSCEGRLLLLSDGTEETWIISPTDIDAAEARIRSEALTLDAARARADRAGHDASIRAREGGAPIDALPMVIEAGRRSEYPMTENRTRCRYCAYQELCAPEQDGNGTTSSDRASAA